MPALKKPGRPRLSFSLGDRIEVGGKSGTYLGTKRGTWGREVLLSIDGSVIAVKREGPVRVVRSQLEFLFDSPGL
jgi:hypothetical protein